MEESNEYVDLTNTNSEEKSLRELGKMEMGPSIHKDNAKKYCQMVVGSIIGEELASALVDRMEADENDMIDARGVMAPFSVEHWPREVLSGVVDILENSEEMHGGYREMLAKTFHLEQDKVEMLSTDSIHKAAGFIREQLESSDKDVAGSELMGIFESKCFLLDDSKPEDEKYQHFTDEQSDDSSS